MRSDAHRELSEEAHDHLALYVLDGMRAAEVSRFEEHLGCCAVCRQGVARLGPVAMDLVLGGPSSHPPAGLKQRMLERARPHRFALRTLARRIWHASDVEGVEITQLCSDVTSGRHTILIRMQAGASIPTHRHPGPEECFIVEGDLRDGDFGLAAGDYVCHQAGTEHCISTRGGCLLLVTTESPETPPAE